MFSGKRGIKRYSGDLVADEDNIEMNL